MCASCVFFLSQYETPAGYALFKLLDEGKIKNVDNIYKYFETSEAAQSLYDILLY